MKKYILGLVIMFFLASCQEHKSENQQVNIDGSKAELGAIEGDETIFLGLRFGMEGEEVHKHFQDLVSQGELELLPQKYISDKGKIYTYNFDFGDESQGLQNVQATFKTYYIKDKLYKLRITVESEKESNLPLLKAKITEDYILKFGDDYIVQENTLNNSDRFVWIDGIRMIEISEGFSNNVLIIYSNLKAVKEKEESSRQTLMREV